MNRYVEERFQAVMGIAESGIPIFPCMRGTKKPLVNGGFLSATSDTKIVEEGFRRFRGCLWGMPTGAVSGVLVLDLDIDADKGINGVEAVEHRNLALPDTFCQFTKRGGRHYYYAQPSFRTKCVVDAMQGLATTRTGIDIRGDGGYVILWGLENEPSEGEGLADAPDWLLNAARHTSPVGDTDVPDDGWKLSPFRMQEIKEQLACIPADDLMTWIKIGFALRSIKGGFPLWEEWSRKSVKYKPGEPERRWRTFTPDGGCGEGTIDRIAKQYGWCPRHITADLEG